MTIHIIIAQFPHKANQKSPPPTNSAAPPGVWTKNSSEREKRGVKMRLILVIREKMVYNREPYIN